MDDLNGTYPMKLLTKVLRMTFIYESLHFYAASNVMPAFYCHSTIYVSYERARLSESGNVDEVEKEKLELECFPNSS